MQLSEDQSSNNFHGLRNQQVGGGVMFYCRIIDQEGVIPWQAADDF